MTNKETKNTLNFRGSTGDYFKIWMINTVLTIITFGIFSAWAKVRSKQYFYSHTYLNNHQFEYHGSPLRILAARVVVAFFCIMAYINWCESERTIVISALVATLLLPILLWDNRRYEPSVSRYEGIGFSSKGSLSRSYIMLWIRIVILSLVIYYVLKHSPDFIYNVRYGYYPKYYIILGFIGIFIISSIFLSWFDSGLKNYFFNNVRYGEINFYSSINVVEMYNAYMKPVLLLLVTVMTFGSLYMFCDLRFENNNSFSFILISSIIQLIGYTATLFSLSYLYVKKTHFMYFNVFSDSMLLTFRSSLETKPFFKLMLINAVMLICTLGIAWPFVKIRTMKHLTEHLHVIGDIDQVVEEAANVAGYVKPHVVELESA